LTAARPEARALGALAAIAVVFKKEVLDNARDLRTLLLALLSPLIGPLLAAGLIAVLGHERRVSLDAPLYLPVIGREHAPNLIAFLKEHDTEIEVGPEDPEKAVAEGRVDLVLIISEAYGEALRRGEPAPLRLVLDHSRRSAQETTLRARQLLEAYSRQVAALRLLARGVDPAIEDALQVETVDVSTPEGRAALIFNMLPYFLIFAAFMGGLYVAVDTTTGERERGSLEALVVNPVARSSLVLGKLGATLLFSWIALGETTLGFLLLPRLVPMESLGFPLALDGRALFLVYLLALPVVLLASSAQMIVATFASTFREAQTYLSLLVMAPMFPGMFLAAVPVHPKPWMMFIPTFAEQLLINQILRGEPIPTLHVLAAAGTTTLAGGALVAVAVRLYRGERVVFGR
jgi:sodium transport system permease protein